MTTLTDAQFNTLHTLREFGPKTAVEVLLPPGMDGTRKTKLEFNVCTKTTLSALNAAGLVRVHREPLPRVKNAAGKKGHPRTALRIEITDAGIAALDAT